MVIALARGGGSAVAGNVNPTTGVLVAGPVHSVSMVIRDAHTDELLRNDTSPLVRAASRLVKRLREKLTDERK